MKRFLFAVSIFAVFAFSSSAFAAGYGAAGCGWGGKVIGNNNDKFAQLGASLLNGSSGNQTFAITSGTSGCGKSGIVLAQKEQALFVENNYHSIAKEMAVGEGENLNTLAGLMGCPANQAETFAAFAQQNYDSIFSADQVTASEMLSSLKDGLSSDPVLSISCHRI